ncbi:hypothetical protein GJV82_18560 [Cellulosimicrobium sp. BIT-GX5]|uniref:Thioredoxin family protein n=2 Tax=Cellulosimicrobium TaxID=157920 RepID=A0A6N7ZN94_9MICO|nr:MULTISPECIES: hypothetical protein [Cellulosimicrobium]MTG90922.1 hypothetical protein [Cellulosimicrobium composti]
MKVELLVIDECPNEVPALEVLRRVLDKTGIDAAIATVVITDDDQAQAHGFHGSPSFHVDGRDLFPVPTVRPGVACRVYPTTAGLRGVPDDHSLTAALMDRVGR